MSQKDFEKRILKTHREISETISPYYNWGDLSLIVNSPNTLELNKYQQSMFETIVPVLAYLVREYGMVTSDLFYRLQSDDLENHGLSISPEELKESELFANTMRTDYVRLLIRKYFIKKKSFTQINRDRKFQKPYDSYSEAFVSVFNAEREYAKNVLIKNYAINTR